MTSVLTGVNALIAGRHDVAVLAELISSIDFETLQNANQARPLTITQDQFDLFIARQGRNFMEAGLLDESFEPTGVVITALN